MMIGWLVISHVGALLLGVSLGVLAMLFLAARARAESDPIRSATSADGAPVDL